LPTVHLSLPNSLYAELKEKAAEYGIQVTDLIKMFVKHGLEVGLVGMSKPRADRGECEEIKRRLEELERQNKLLRGQYYALRGKIREMEEFIEYLIRRIDTLEEQIVGGVDVSIVDE